MRLSLRLASLISLCLGMSHAVNTPAAQTTSVARERAPASCNYGKPHPDAPAELQQFAFLIGDFEITSHIMTPNGWSPPRPGPRARWNGHYSMGGMMITDEWYDPDPGLQRDSPRGINVRYYDETANEWKMMWVATAAGQVQDLRAKIKNNKLTMWQVYPTEIDLVADFTVEDDDHWHRISYSQTEDGRWTPQFKLRASRIKCD